MGLRLQAGPVRTQTSQSVTGEGRIPGLGVTDRDEREGRRANVSICNNWEQISHLAVTDRDTGIPPRLQSRSVTSWAPKPLLLLQIETFKIRRKVCLDL